MINGFSLGMMIDIVKREVQMRRSVYPRQVGMHKMTQRNADLQIAGMEAVLKTLEELRDTGKTTAT